MLRGQIQKLLKFQIILLVLITVIPTLLYVVRQFRASNVCISWPNGKYELFFLPQDQDQQTHCNNLKCQKSFTTLNLRPAGLLVLNLRGWTKYGETAVDLELLKRTVHLCGPQLLGFFSGSQVWSSTYMGNFKPETSGYATPFFFFFCEALSSGAHILHQSRELPQWARDISFLLGAIALHLEADL